MTLVSKHTETYHDIDCSRSMQKRARVKDLQLALFLARVIGDEEQLKNTLEFIIQKSW